MAKPKRPSQRELTLSHMRIAGYDDDSATWTRLLVEGRISYAVAKEAWRQGKAMKAAGIPRS
jgi:hypothetical protein